MDTLTPRRGAIHIHTAYSDGSGDMPEIIAAALAAGLDFIVVSDHDFPFAREHGWNGRHAEGRLCVVAGTELRTRETRDILALDASARIDTRTLNSAAALALLAKHGIRAFLAHPQGNRQFWSGNYRYSWDDWEVGPCAGAEVWSYLHDWVRTLSLRCMRKMCEHPQDFISGPDREALLRWDKLAEKRRVAGLGALDVHATKFPRLLRPFFPWARNGVLPYAHTFKAFSHWALISDKSWHDPAADLAQSVCEALASARGWICREELGCGRDFRFQLQASDTGRLSPVGTETAFVPGQRLLVTSPLNAEIRLLCRGATVAKTEGNSLDFAPMQPGEYRVEAYLDGRHWILSNHIYLRLPTPTGKYADKA